ncbi:MAG TPA: FMN-binding glutamate synthase family protein [Candidatus Brocadiia bacterium]|nr:FMN-binding glutamate synthase family protein [Planctomycetota bacterium]MDO8092840.1 FMN-binding glutamate synthase family protein [Candidatus Brocadiales bacterium]
MSLSKVNATSVTRTKNRTPDSVTPNSGMCAVCLDGCPGLCEIGRSAFRGAEVIYPQPFGLMTSAAEKDYPVDFSYFNIMGTTVGAHGIKADSDLAIFTNVNLETRLGRDKGIKLKLPIVIPGLGSTNVAKNHWDGLAVGSAITGTGLTIGENVCGMDSNSKFSNGRVTHCPDLEYRVKTYKEWQHDGYGMIVLQANVEDSRLGVLEYGIETLKVDAVELKWGQGAKDIGGEVKLNSLERAKLLKSRGYIVLPDPEDPTVQDAYNRGAFKEFERHSRVGMVPEKTNAAIEEFAKIVEGLRKKGAKYVFLKTGAYRPADLARAVRLCSEAKVDVLTVDGAGGGTGMSPWRMMNEWGIPTVYISAMTYNYVDKLAKKGKHVPDIILAGGLSLEDHLFKAFALGAPYVKAVGMARAAVCAAMVGKTIGNLVNDNKIPKSLEEFGKTVDEVFILSTKAKREFSGNGKVLPSAGLGLYTFYQRLAQGLRQIMAGERKFTLEHITRDDIVSLTREAAEVTGITYIMDADKELAEKILG